MKKHIVSKTPGCVVYQSLKDGEVLYAFTDVCLDPQGQEHVVPGRGRLAQTISSFLFDRLSMLHLPSHFIKSEGPSESLMYATKALPFETTARCGASKAFAKKFSIQEGMSFERPILDFYHHPNKTLISESHLVSCDIISMEDFDDLQALMIRTIDTLRGLFIGVGLDLVDITLQFGQSFGDDSSPFFFLMGELSPEVFCVRNIKTGDFLGGSYLFDNNKPPIEHYREIAQCLGLPTGQPFLSNVVLFQKRR